MLLGRTLRERETFVTIAYGTLAAVAFLGAIGAAYLHPRLLDPVEDVRGE